MKFLDEYRNPQFSNRILKEIEQCITRRWTIMEVCGGQTHSIIKYGIDHLLPSSIQLLHGPGCPVCVTPLETIDRAHAIATGYNVILCSYGDMLRVPGSKTDLLVLKSQGKDIRIIYSPLDAVEIAFKNPNRQVVFLAIGFETTAAPNAMAVKIAAKRGCKNFSILSSHVLVPPSMTAILDSPENQVQSFLGPGHVCTITGYAEYESIVQKYQLPIVITGFEPLDLLEGILCVVRQLESGKHHIENQYKRTVKRDGNPYFRKIIEEVFEVCDQKWRGIGLIPRSGLQLRGKFREYDANYRFSVSHLKTEEPSLCMSGQILRGLKKPNECPAFGKKCTPHSPLGATMVSSEGACSSYFNYGRYLECR